jgi:cytochrome d ubiquinol oxidase subunit II
MAPELLLAGALLVALVLYALGAGADFGGGVWDLLARGPRAAAQRELVAHAIGPIWEANHVWLILVVVLLFACFPAGFAAIMTGLFVPLTLLLFGVVLRGSAFAFRSYGDESDRAQARWGRVFAVASLVSPVMLGVCVGAIASGGVAVPTGLPPRLFEPWLAPVPLAIGLLTLALFAFLAAVYLTLETEDPGLREDFRRRALGSGVLVGALALASLGLAQSGAPLVYAALTGRAWSPGFHVLTGACAVAALAALWTRRFGAARALAVLQATLVLSGWALAQHPYLLPPRLTFAAAAAPRQVLELVLVALGGGALLLVPSLLYLFRVFKAARAEQPAD